jgi:hypothetical protein
MKLGRVLLPLLALASCCVCLAQDDPPEPDQTQRAVTQAGTYYPEAGIGVPLWGDCIAPCAAGRTWIVRYESR